MSLCAREDDAILPGWGLRGTHYFEAHQLFKYKFVLPLRKLFYLRKERRIQIDHLKMFGEILCFFIEPREQSAP